MRRAPLILTLLLVVACGCRKQPAPPPPEEAPPPVEAHPPPQTASPPDAGPAHERDQEAPGGMGGTGAEPPPRPPAQPEVVRHGDTSPEFPWPPPAPSASTTVPGKLLPAPTQGTTLGQVADRLSTALLLEDYSQQAWFRIPQGFALVTQLEQIHADGTPVLPPDRWGDRLRPEKIRNLRDYLMGLFVAPAGRFRIIVFLVTSATVPRGAPIGREEAEQWLLSGTLELDRAMRAEPYTPDHKVLVLIYEYEKPSSSARANLVMPSALSALEHLKAAGITNALQGQP